MKEIKNNFYLSIRYFSGKVRINGMSTCLQDKYSNLSNNLCRAFLELPIQIFSIVSQCNDEQLVELLESLTCKQFAAKFEVK